ncbi:hypothetical protein RINTHM_370 [Richelia intracellularis HM01]|uniref:DUF1517 domain-containing protein n=1 Tax=Richelia intracellularis TaxID=1164990 RepID=UPI0002B5F846|nr:DUF1517 domain-containing protein [Richelia intracellularis]CCH64520.1 hypothetical protein RINTHM_370 [Richelia intracellularis HM01]
MRNVFNKMMGYTRYVVCRLFVHLTGPDIAPILGVLNDVARKAINADGNLDILGEELVEVCQTLLQYDENWLSAANEGDVFWDEGEAGDYVNEIFTDSAERYLSSSSYIEADDKYPLSLPATRNVVVMITVAYKGEVEDLETSIADTTALRMGLKAIINLHYNHLLQAIQIHFSPAQFGDDLTNDQLIQYYPELIPL